jgi:hypothetical protein
MKPPQSKLEHQQAEEQTVNLQAGSQTQSTESVRAFESVESMLREDAASTPVPPAVEEKLARSVQQQPRPKRSWWNRWRAG